MDEFPEGQPVNNPVSDLSQEPQVVDLTEELAAETPNVERPEPEPDPDEPGGSWADVAEPGVDVTPGEPPLSRAYFRRQAQLYINTFDLGQKTLMASFVYPKAIMQPGDQELLDEYFNSQKTKGRKSTISVPTDNDAVFYALQRLRDFEKRTSELPLTPDEKESLTKPLTDVLEKHQSRSLSPEMALVMAVVLVMLPRMEPCFPAFFKMFK